MHIIMRIEGLVLAKKNGLRNHFSSPIQCALLQLLPLVFKCHVDIKKQVLFKNGYLVCELVLLPLKIIIIIIIIIQHLFLRHMSSRS